MNLGETLLVAAHLHRLFENLQHGLAHPSQIAYITIQIKDNHYVFWR